MTVILLYMEYSFYFKKFIYHAHTHTHTQIPFNKILYCSRERGQHKAVLKTYCKVNKSRCLRLQGVRAKTKTGVCSAGKARAAGQTEAGVGRASAGA